MLSLRALGHADLSGVLDTYSVERAEIHIRFRHVVEVAEYLTARILAPNAMLASEIRDARLKVFEAFD